MLLRCDLQQQGYSDSGGGTPEALQNLAIPLCCDLQQQGATAAAVLQRHSRIWRYRCAAAYSSVGRQWRRYSRGTPESGDTIALRPTAARGDSGGGTMQMLPDDKGACQERFDGISFQAYGSRIKLRNANCNKAVTLRVVINHNFLRLYRVVPFILA